MGPAALMTARIACLPNVNHKWLPSWAANGRLIERNSWIRREAYKFQPKTLANSKRISSQIYVDILYWSN